MNLEGRPPLDFESELGRIKKNCSIDEMIHVNYYCGYNLLWSFLNQKIYFLPETQTVVSLSCPASEDSEAFWVYFWYGTKKKMFAESLELTQHQLGEKLCRKSLQQSVEYQNVSISQYFSVLTKNNGISWKPKPTVSKLNEPVTLYMQYSEKRNARYQFNTHKAYTAV